MEIGDIFRLRGLLRGVSHTETLAAADSGDAEDTARRLVFTPTLPNEWIAITRISTQAIEPNTLSLVARDLNRSDFALHLTPDLVVPDVPLIGSLSEGIEIVARNRTAKPVDVLFHCAVFSERNLMRILRGEA